jgi:hypothetical protein
VAQKQSQCSGQCQQLEQDEFPKVCGRYKKQEKSLAKTAVGRSTAGTSPAAAAAMLMAVQTATLQRQLLQTLLLRLLLGEREQPYSGE